MSTRRKAKRQQKSASQPTAAGICDGRWCAVLCDVLIECSVGVSDGCSQFFVVRWPLAVGRWCADEFYRSVGWMVGCQLDALCCGVVSCCVFEVNKVLKRLRITFNN